jgi:hypothetical protein
MLRSISLERYNPYLHPQKVSKNLKIECVRSSVPKITKSRFCSPCPLEVNSNASSCNGEVFINAKKREQ